MVSCATDWSPAVRGPRESLSLVCLPSYCDQLKASESTHVLQPFLPGILDGLIHLAAQFSSEVLSLVMETLCTVCTVDPAFTASVESKVCPFTIAVFLKYSNGTPPGRAPHSPGHATSGPMTFGMMSKEWLSVGGVARAVGAAG